MSRSCARPGCGNDAVATLSYAYADGLVVLEDLAAEAHPMVHDLCQLHAEGLRVPLGWELRDDRSVDDRSVDDRSVDDRSVAADLRDTAGGQLDLIGA